MQNAIDDEIDLRLYVERIWRGRYVIAAVTLGAALLAFLVSRLLLPRVYEASVLLVVQPQETQASPENAPAVQVVALTPAGYKEIVASDPFQALVREGMVRENRANLVGFSLEARVVAQSNLLELKAEGPDALSAARVANYAASLLRDEVVRVNRASVQSTLQQLAEQRDHAKQAMDEAVARLQAFSERGAAVQELQSERDSKLQLIAQYQTRLSDLEISLATQRAGLEELRKQLAAQPAVIKLDRVLSPEGAALAQAARSLDLQRAEPLVNLQDEQLNPVHVTLASEVSIREASVVQLSTERDQVKEALARLSDDVKKLTGELVALQAQQRELEWQVESARRSYETASQQYQLQQSVLAGRTGDSALTVVRPAVPPAAPSRPRVLLNTVVAAFLGLMASVFGVFVVDWLREPAPAAAPGAARGVPSVGQ
ncbi:Wzz/FepE/Etk N-terminal domain-containing protein [Carboxydochorda subterranea]|uniref:Wzz/FepE/Etk N-terminal domain-containing protein n=1 Tax=Carboxydichorda subterranea TaxID=3109565 RepID=A0ABZ1BZ17_9FIRM|nr:Wzz/FepE/Etk N-terminal domain-containing protein [Limnochorda sp. L945t]WRP17976.1 Wzz/FepE/Etk N-terminal domain-containing protein [Limnochorda sp. L945t]